MKYKPILLRLLRNRIAPHQSAPHFARIAAGGLAALLLELIERGLSAHLHIRQLGAGERRIKRFGDGTVIVVAGHGNVFRRRPRLRNMP